jgi:glutamate carboxypeptidase
MAEAKGLLGVFPMKNHSLKKESTSIGSNLYKVAAPWPLAEGQIGIDKSRRDIKQKVDFFRDEQLNLLKTLVSFDSGTGNLEGNRKVVEVLEPILSTMTREVRCIESPGVGIHLISRLGKPGASRKVLCLAHLDTIFAPGEARENPFRIEGDRLYGLGVVDCKGGVVVSLYGLKTAIELGLIPEDLEITVIYNCDEETGSLTSSQIFATESREAQLALVFEPSQDRCGFISHRRGVVCGSFEAFGNRAVRFPHQVSSDANLAISRLTASLESHNDLSRDIFFQVVQTMGGKSEGGVKPDRDLAKADFNVTFGNDNDLRYIKQTISKIAESTWAPESRVEPFIKVSHRSPARMDSDERAFNLVIEAGRNLGLELVEEHMIGSSDANLCAFYGLSTIDALGPSMYDIHTKKESLSLKTVKERTELLAMSIALLDKEFFKPDAQA